MKSSEWNYVLLTLAAFVFTPELHRLVNWRGNFDPINAVAVIPLLMLCPIAAIAYRRRHKLRSRNFAIVAILYVAGFTYATFIAAAYGTILQALFAFAEFCLPVTVGAWLMTREETMEEAHARFARALLTFGAIAAAYGVFQYVVAPPWDTAWMQNIEAEAFGQPERFGIRVFGCLNSPGTFALFLGAVIVFNLPYLRTRNVFNMAALLLMTLGMLLSFVRTAWISVLVGVAIFVWLSPRRVQTLLGVASVAVVCGTAILALFLASPDSAITDKISDRLSTLTDVGSDGSTLARQQTAQATLQKAFEQPAGAGLGLTGNAQKLGSSEAAIFRGFPAGPIDNGFLSRFFEMGFVGFALFISACCASIGFAAAAYARSRRRGDRWGMLVGASCLAAQLIIVGVNGSGDDQQGLLGVLFFVALALPMMASTKESEERPVHDSPAPRRMGFARRSAFQ